MNVPVFFAGISQIRGLGERSVASVYKSILEDETLAKKTLGYRSLPLAERDTYKKSEFPYIVPGALFNAPDKRDSKNIKHLTGYISYDLDDIPPDSISDVRDCILQVQIIRPVLLFVSPSGTGIKVIYEVTNLRDTYSNPRDTYKAAWIQVFNLLPIEVQNLVDAGCKDATRAMFLAHDNEVFFNETPGVFEVDTTPERLPFVGVSSNKLDNENQCVVVLENFLQQKTSLAIGDEIFVIIIAFLTQLSNASKAHGYMLEFLRCMPKHADVNSKWHLSNGEKLATEKFNWWKKNRRKNVSLDFIVKLLSENSEVDVVTLRSDNISTLEHSDKIITALNQDMPDYPNAYGDREINFFQSFIKKRKIQVDRFSDMLIHPGANDKLMVFVQKKEAETLSLNLGTLYKMDTGKKFNATNSDKLFNSTFIPTYHPLIELWNTYKESDFEGTISSVASTIQGITQEGRDYFKAYIVKAGAMALMGNPNEFILSVVGAKEVGKTAFCKHLWGANTYTPKDYPAFKKWNQNLSNYLSVGGFRREDKDNYSRMVDNLCVMIDEFTSSTDNKVVPIEVYKELATTTNVTVRRPFRRDPFLEKRQASLCVTSNSLDFITDSEDNRRFIPLNITGIDWHRLNRIDIGKMWAEGLALGFNNQIEITNKMRIWLKRASAKHTTVTIEQDLVSYLECPAADQVAEERGVVYVTLSEVKAHYGGEYARANTNRIVYYLQQGGFKSKILNNVKKFALLENWKITHNESANVFHHG